MAAKSERFELRLDEELMGRIDDWRRAERDAPTRAEAIRRLVSVGLEQGGHNALFQMTRFQILCTAKTKGTEDYLSSAYVYAWAEGVYPLFENTDLHKPFADQFRVSAEMVEELSKYLDEQEIQGAVPTFYQLEDYYGVRSSRTPWDRMQLIDACRYMFLRGMWGDEFWKALLKGSDHPSEAKSIVRPYDASDIYLL